MITYPPCSSWPSSPCTVTLIFRTVLKRKLKLRIDRLTIFQRLGSLRTLIHKWVRSTTPINSNHKDRTAVSLTNLMTHPKIIDNDRLSQLGAGHLLPGFAKTL